MSDRVNIWWHHLWVLGSSEQQLFDCLIWYENKEFIVCLGEIFLNLGNLSFQVPESDLEYFRKNIKHIEILSGIGRGARGDLRKERGVIRAHPRLVKRGVKVTLAYLTRVGFLTNG